MSTVKVDVAMDSNGDVNYIFNGECYGFFFMRDHSYDEALNVANGLYLPSIGKNLPIDAIIHTYEVEIAE